MPVGRFPGMLLSVNTFMNDQLYLASTGKGLKVPCFDLCLYYLDTLIFFFFES